MNFWEQDTVLTLPEEKKVVNFWEADTVEGQPAAPQPIVPTIEPAVQESTQIPITTPPVPVKQTLIETPKEEPGLLKNIAKGFASGTAGTIKAATQIPGGLVDIYAQATNSTNAILNKALGTNYATDFTADKRFYENPFTKALEDFREKNDVVKAKFGDKGIAQIAKEGGAKEVGSYLFHNAVTSLPLTVGAIAATASGAGMPAIVAAFSGTSFGQRMGETRDKMAQDKIDVANLPKETLANMAQGAVDGFSELLGSVPIAKMLKKSIDKVGVEVTRQGFKATMGNFAKKTFTGFAEEGLLEEGGASIANDMIDNISGKQQHTPLEMVTNFFTNSAIGGIVGAPFGAASAAIEQANPTLPPIEPPAPGPTIVPPEGDKTAQPVDITGPTTEAQPRLETLTEEATPGEKKAFGVEDETQVATEAIGAPVVPEQPVVQAQKPAAPVQALPEAAQPSPRTTQELVAVNEKRRQERTNLEDVQNNIINGWLQDGQITAEQKNDPGIQKMAMSSADKTMRNEVTGLPSKAHLHTETDNIYKTLQPDEDIIAVAADQDFFKPFNDTYSHKVGDNVLKQVMPKVNYLFNQAGFLKGFHESGDEHFAIGKVKKSDYKQAVEVINDIKSEMAKISITLPNGKIVPLSMTLSISNDPVEADVLRSKSKDDPNVGRNGIAIDKNLQKVYTLSNQKGKDVSGEYINAGLKGRGLTDEKGNPLRTSIPLSGQKQQGLGGTDRTSGERDTGKGGEVVEAAKQPAPAAAAPSVIPNYLPSNFPLKDIVAQYAKKETGKGFSKAHRKTLGQKQWGAMTKEERLSEVKAYIAEDMKVAKEEAKDPITYLTDRVLDPLDPLNEFYAEVMRRMGYKAVAGKNVSGTPKPQVEPSKEVKKQPWEIAKENVKPYEASLRKLTDKELRSEDKKVSDDLDKWANNTPTFMPDRTLNPKVGRDPVYFDLSEKLAAIGREQDARKQVQPPKPKRPHRPKGTGPNARPWVFNKEANEWMERPRRKGTTPAQAQANTALREMLVDGRFAEEKNTDVMKAKDLEPKFDVGGEPLVSEKKTISKGPNQGVEVVIVRREKDGMVAELSPDEDVYIDGEAEKGEQGAPQSDKEINQAVHNFKATWLMEDNFVKEFNKLPKDVQNQFVKSENAYWLRGDNPEKFYQEKILRNVSFMKKEAQSPVTSWAKKKFGDTVAKNGKPVWQNFMEWFGDSKVVDENGEPLVVYHGTESEFGKDVFIFDKKKLGTGGFKQIAFSVENSNIAGGAIYTTTSKEFAKYYGDVVELYAKSRNPLIINSAQEIKDWIGEYNVGKDESDDDFATTAQDVIDGYGGISSAYNLDETAIKYLIEAKKKGNDAVILDFKNLTDANGMKLGKLVLLFSPSQIKSTANQGTFSAAEEDIRFQKESPDGRSRRTGADNEAIAGRGTSVTPLITNVKEQFATALEKYVPKDFRGNVTNNVSTRYFSFSKEGEPGIVRKFNADEIAQISINSKTNNAIISINAAAAPDAKEIQKRTALIMKRDNLSFEKAQEKAKEELMEELVADILKHEMRHFGLRLLAKSDPNTLRIVDKLFEMDTDNEFITKLREVYKTTPEDVLKEEWLIRRLNQYENRQAYSKAEQGIIVRVWNAIKAFFRNTLARLGVKDIRTQDDIFGQIIKDIQKVRGKDIGASTEAPIETFAKPVKADTFFSPTLRAVEALKQEKGVVPQLLSMIKGGQLKKAEVEWLGLEDYLKEHPQATRTEVAEWVRGNQVTIEEVKKGKNIQQKENAERKIEELEYRLKRVQEEAKPYTDKGEDAPAKLVEEATELHDWISDLQHRVNTVDDTKFSQDVLPGAVEGSYREVLLKMPIQGETGNNLSVKESSDLKDLEYIVERGTNGTDELTPKEKERYDYLTNKRWKANPASLGGFKSSHWSEPNVFAHARLNDRVGPNGEKVLFVEEVQSDWARLAREKGVAENITKDSAMQMGFTVYKAKASTGNEKYFIDNPTDEFFHRKGFTHFGFDTETKAWDGIVKKLKETSEAVPSQPFLKNWQEVTLKRILRMASEEGYDRISWINGKQTADRYDLSKQVSKVIYHPKNQTLIAMSTSGNEVLREVGVAPERIQDYVGKEPARKLLEQPVVGGGILPGTAEQVIEGEDLKVGGLWAQNLYDKQVPNIMNKIGKKFNAAVEETDLGENERPSKLEIFETSDGTFEVEHNGNRIPFKTETEAERYVDKITGFDNPEGQIGVQQSLPITEQMRESVVYEGQPLFNKRGSSESAYLDTMKQQQDLFGGEGTVGYFQGNKGIYTGKSEMINGVQFYEMKMSEGTSKGEMRITKTAPSASQKALDAISRQRKAAKVAKDKGTEDLPLFEGQKPEAEQLGLFMKGGIDDKYDPDLANDVDKAFIADKAKQLERMERSFRAKLNFAPKYLEQERTELAMKIAEAREEKLDEIRQAIYEYSRRIGLNAEGNNHVDTLLKNAKSTKALNNALDYMDDVIQEKVNRKLIKMVNGKLTDIKHRVAKAESGARKGGFDYRTNMKLKEYLDGLTSASEATRDSMKKTLAWFMQHPDEEIPENIMNSTKELFKQTVHTMSNEQLRGVLDEINQIKKLGYLKKKLLDVQRRRRQAALIRGLVRQIGIKPGTAASKIERERHGRISDRLNQYKNNVLTPETIIENLTGELGKTETNLKDVLFEPIRKATFQKAIALKKTVEDIRKIFKDNKIDYKEAAKTDYVLENDIEDGQGRVLSTETLTIPIDEMMFVYAHSQNSGGLEHLRATYSDKFIDQVKEKLSANYKKAVDDMIDYYDTKMYPRLNEVFKRLYNIDMPKEQRYFPITNLDVKHAETEMVADVLARHGARIGIQYGAVKARTNAKNRFKRASFIETVQKHARDTEHYLAMTEPITEIRNIIESPSIREAIEAKDRGAYAALSQWVKDNAYGRIRSSESTLDKLADFVRKNTVTSIFGLNLMVTLKQPLSLFPAVPYVGKGNMVKSLSHFSTSPLDSIKFVYGKSVFMKMRTENIERELAEFSESKRAGFLTGGAKLDAIRNLAVLPITISDQMTAVVVWMSAYSKNLKQTKNEASALKYADYVVRKTQSTGDLVNMPGLYRTTGWKRMFTMFTSALNKNTNLLYTMFMQRDIGKKDLVARLFWTMIAGGLAEYLISHLTPPKNWLKDMKDDPEGILRSIVQQGSSGLPFFGDLIDATLAGTRTQVRTMRDTSPDQGPFDAELSTPIMSVWQDIANTLNAFPKIVTGDLKATDVMRALTIVGKLTGLPALGPRTVKAAVKGEPSLMLVSQRATKDLSKEAYWDEKGMPMTSNVRKFLETRTTMNRAFKRYADLQKTDEAKASEFEVANIKLFNWQSDLEQSMDKINDLKQQRKQAIKDKAPALVRSIDNQIDSEAKIFNGIVK